MDHLKDGNFKISVPTTSIVNEGIDYIRWNEYHAHLFEKCS